MIRIWIFFGNKCLKPDDSLESDCLADQPIWYNSKILINNQPFIFVRAWRAGIVFLRDLFLPDANMKSLIQLRNEFNDSLDWLQYGQIINAIPVAVRINIDVNSYCLLKYDRLLSFSKISNIIYSDMIKHENVVEGRRVRWTRKLKIDIPMSEFLKCFRNLYQHTIATKFRDFQYRLLIGSLPTNRKLFLWKIKDSQMCSFCNAEIEDEIHLFIECSRIQSIWEALRNYIDHSKVDKNDYIDLVWSHKNILFSQVHPVPSDVVNFLVTIAKQYIYKVCCMQSILSAEQLINDIENIFNMETNIALRKGKMRKHRSKWKSIKNLPEDDDNYIDNYIDNL